MLWGKIIRKLKKYSIRTRVLYYKLRGVTVGRNTKIYGKIKIIGKASHLIIGDHCTLNHGVLLVCRDKIVLKDHVRLSPYAKLITGGLNLEQYPRQHYKAPIILDHNVWVASGAVITAGVTIGENSVVGANAVVRKDLPANVFAGGVPAKVIKKISIKE